MLDSMRKLSKGIVAKLLMLLLIVSFGVWGVGDILQSGGPTYAAKVGGETIGLAEFQQQRSLVSRQLEALNIKNLPPGELEISVIRQLVQQKLIVQVMRDMGLFVNDTLASKTIAAIPDFQDEKGNFSATRFKNIVAREHLNEATFVAQTKRDIAGRFLIDSLAMKDATPPASVLALSAMVAGETRDAVLFTLSAGDALDETNDTALKAFYEENKTALYMSPETRTLDYVVLSEGEIETLVDRSITDAMVDEAIASNKTLTRESARAMLKKEQRDSVLHDFGNRVEDELAAGKTMAEAFTKAGISANPRTLENITQASATSGDDISKTVAEQGFGLSEGEISRLIRSKQGVLLMVSAKKITPASPKPFSDVKADVTARLAKQLARDAARAKALRVKTELAKAPNWQAVAEEQHLSSRLVSHLKRPIEGKPLAGNGVPPALQQAIFERKVGEVAGPLTLDNGDQMLALVTQSHLPPVDVKALAASSDAAAASGLSQDIENRAFQSFTAKHKVTINPGLLRQAASEQ